jgi:hypothetical protein
VWDRDHLAVWLLIFFFAGCCPLHGAIDEKLLGYFAASAALRDFHLLC